MPIPPPNEKNLLTKTISFINKENSNGLRIQHCFNPTRVSKPFCHPILRPNTQRCITV